MQGAKKCAALLRSQIVANAPILPISDIEFVFLDLIGQGRGGEEFLVHRHEELAAALLNQIVMTGPGFPVGDTPDHGVQAAGQKVCPPLDLVELMDQGQLMNVRSTRKAADDSGILPHPAASDDLELIPMDRFPDHPEVHFRAVIHQVVDTHIQQLRDGLQIHDVRQTLVGFPFGNCRPGDTQLFGQLLLG